MMERSQSPSELASKKQAYAHMTVQFDHIILIETTIRKLLSFKYLEWTKERARTQIAWRVDTFQVRVGHTWLRLGILLIIDALVRFNRHVASDAWDSLNLRIDHCIYMPRYGVFEMCMYVAWRLISRLSTNSRLQLESKLHANLLYSMYGSNGWELRSNAMCFTKI